MSAVFDGVVALYVIPPPWLSSNAGAAIQPVPASSTGGNNALIENSKMAELIDPIIQDAPR